MGGAARLAAAPLAGRDRAPFGIVDGAWLTGAALRCTSGADERITAEYGGAGEAAAAAADPATQTDTSVVAPTAAHRARR